MPARRKQPVFEVFVDTSGKREHPSKRIVKIFCESGKRSEHIDCVCRPCAFNPLRQLFGRRDKICTDSFLLLFGDNVQIGFKNISGFFNQPGHRIGRNIFFRDFPRPPPSFVCCIPGGDALIVRSEQVFSVERGKTESPGAVIEDKRLFVFRDGPGIFCCILYHL